MYLIQTDDFYHDIRKDITKKFDTSDYYDHHPSGIKTGVNKKVIGKFKDEVGGNQITHFVGLRPKFCILSKLKRNIKKMKKEK